MVEEKAKAWEEVEAWEGAEAQAKVEVWADVEGEAADEFLKDHNSAMALLRCTSAYSPSPYRWQGEGIFLRPASSVL